MRIVLCGSFALAALFIFGAPFAVAQGKINYSKATAKIIPLHGNVSVLQVRAPEELDNMGVLAGPDGYLLVDHPEASANPVIQKALDDFGKRPVRFIVNTHWHFDHVGGNEIYAPEAVIIAHENVRKRLMTKQTPPWSEAPIGPYPERAWPRITFRDSLTIHFDAEDIELDHYANGHTDGDSVVYFAQANVVDVGDIFDGKGSLAGGIDMEGIALSLSAVLERTNDDTIILTGHSEPSTRRDLAQYVSLLKGTIEQVRQEISAGKSEKDVTDEGLPEIWTPWFAPNAVPADHDFMQRIYVTLAHTSNPDQ
jgi:cyclase